MRVLAHPEEGRGSTADGDEGGGTGSYDGSGPDGAARGGGSDKGNGVAVMMVPLLLRVVVGIPRAIMKVAYTYGNIVILCPHSFKCIDPQFPVVRSAGIVVLYLQSGI